MSPASRLPHLGSFCWWCFQPGHTLPSPRFPFWFCVYSKEAQKKWQMKTWVLTQCAWGSSASTRERGSGGPRAPPLRTQPSHPCPSQTEGTWARRLSPSSLSCWLGRVRMRPNSILPPRDLHLLNVYYGHRAQGGPFRSFLACTHHDLTSQTLYPHVPPQSLRAHPLIIRTELGRSWTPSLLYHHAEKADNTQISKPIAKY